jgi:hypothetical protein
VPAPLSEAAEGPFAKLAVSPSWIFATYKLLTVTGAGCTLNCNSRTSTASKLQRGTPFVPARSVDGVERRETDLKVDNLNVSEQKRRRCH